MGIQFTDRSFIVNDNTQLCGPAVVSIRMERMNVMHRPNEDTLNTGYGSRTYVPLTVRAIAGTIFGLLMFQLLGDEVIAERGNSFQKSSLIAV